MAVVEILHIAKRLCSYQTKNWKCLKNLLIDAKKEAELEIREANIKAKKIINDAEAEGKKYYY